MLFGHEFQPFKKQDGVTKMLLCREKKTDNETSFWQKLQFRQLFLDKIIRIFKSNLNNISEKKPRKKWFKYIYYCSAPWCYSLQTGFSFPFFFFMGWVHYIYPLILTYIFSMVHYVLWVCFLHSIYKRKNYDKSVTVTRIFFHIS